MTLHFKKKKKIIIIIKNLTTKMKLYTTSEFISNDTSFQKKKKILTTKMKLYTAREFVSNDISFAQKSIIILFYYLRKNYLTD